MFGPATGSVLSLSHGSVLDAEPEHVVRAAAAAGYDACGLRLDPGAVSPVDARRWRAMAEDLGVGFLDLEVVRLGAPGQDRDTHRRLVELAAMLGSRFLVTVGHHATELAMVEDLEWLRTVAEESGVAVALEFMAFTAVPTLQVAARLAHRTGVTVLVDALHLQRSGGDPIELSTLEPGVVGYAQLCDASATPPRGAGALAHEARHGRRPPGTGDLPLAGFVAGVPPRTPWAVEVQSDRLARRMPPVERARHLIEHARAVLAHGRRVPQAHPRMGTERSD